MKRKISIILVLTLLYSLTACGNSDTIRETEELQTKTTEEAVLLIEEKSIEETSKEETFLSYSDGESVNSQTEDYTFTEEDAEKKYDESKKSQHAAYISALKDFYYEHSLPGVEDEPFEDLPISDNRFAVYDVDADGKEELIISYVTTYIAGMMELIYEYDEEMDTLIEQFREFPALTYYDNGVIKAEWSHNQGLAGEFWPYSLYQYNEESDAYEMIAMVDAWDQTYADVNYEGTAFPKEIDENGDGLVYYVMPGNEYVLNTPVDLVAYEQWLNLYIGDAQELSISYHNLTPENIYEINGGYNVQKQLTVEEAWKCLKETLDMTINNEEIRTDENGVFEVVVNKMQLAFTDGEEERPCESVIFFDSEENQSYLFGHYYVFYEGEEVYATNTKGWYEVDCITGSVTIY